MTLNMTTQSCIFRLRNIVVPNLFNDYAASPFHLSHFTKEFLEYSMIQYEMKNTISDFKFVTRNILYFKSFSL